MVYANPFSDRLSLHADFEERLTRELQSAKTSPRGFAAAVVSPGSVGASFKPDDSESKLHDVTIMLHSMSRTPDEMRTHLVTNHGIPREHLTIELRSLNASLTADQILRVAKIDDVMGIYEESEVVLHNHLVGKVINVSDAQRLVTQHLDPKLKLDGDGQVITIADTGLDNGSSLDSKMHPFFTGRVLKLDPRSDKDGLDKNGKKISRTGHCDDLSGHGTHVAGTALGSYANMKPNKEILLQDIRLDGVAPKALLIMQNIFGPPEYEKGVLQNGGKADLKTHKGAGDLGKTGIFIDPYYGYPKGGYEANSEKIIPKGGSSLPGEAVSRIHNNSWGTGLAGVGDDGKEIGPEGYNPNARMLDDIIYKLPDLLVVRSAGNSGDELVTQKWLDGQINAWASAKNAITVGACFNDNQFIKVDNEKEFGDKEPSTLYSSYRPQSMTGTSIPACHVSHLSSRGPTVRIERGHEDIIKPDVVAPGIAIYSARSRVQVTSDDNGVAPGTPPETLCTFKSGSSMAAPVVSGAVALLRQALARRGEQHPSAALIKALIVNGAVDLKTEGGYLYKGNTTFLQGSNQTKNEGLEAAPNNVQGWGRLNIAESVDNVVDIKLCGFQDIKLAKDAVEDTDNDGRLRPNKTHPYPITIPPLPAHLQGGSKPLKANVKATLAWTDIPGVGLHNILALSLNFPDPNLDIKVDWDGSGTDARLKRIGQNNVQKLEVRGITVGDTKIELEARVFAAMIMPNPDLNGKRENQAYAICSKVWYE